MFSGNWSEKQEGSMHIVYKAASKTNQFKNLKGFVVRDAVQSQCNFERLDKT